MDVYIFSFLSLISKVEGVGVELAVLAVLVLGLDPIITQS